MSEKENKDPKQISIRKEEKIGPFNIESVDVLLPNGETATFYRWKKHDIAVVVPITQDNKVLLIREYQVGINKTLLTLPKGGIDTKKDIQKEANRELREETGYSAKKIEHVGTFTTMPGYVSGKVYAFVAQELVEKPLKGDEQWDINVVECSFDQLPELIDRGEISDTRIIASLSQAITYLGKQGFFETDESETSDTE